ncbi:adenosine kinase [Pseudohyphozyma bogoriensis]|nr:adenosine kinase [Pseudohyphozyma bogoriensis]
MAAPSPIFVAMGNPLLDMQVTKGEALLEKYGLKSNDAVLAEGKQLEIYEDLQKNYQITYVAGGAAQNAARGVQYVLPAGSTAYLGAVGSDDLASQLRAANEKEGLYSAYQVTDQPTGACAVVITGHDRSLCTQLGAAEHFKPSHLATPEVQALIASAKYFYLGGFFLTHGLESAKVLAQHALDNRKIFSMNLSAPFIPQFFKSQVDEILPYVDILIGNESEAEAYAASHEWDTKDIPTIAIKLAQSKKLASRPRIVVITQGSSSTVVASSNTASAAPTTKTYPVTLLDSSEIVDTNAAGDAFAGGFLGAYVLGKSVDQAVLAGHKLAAICIGQEGATFKYPKVDLFA